MRSAETIGEYARAVPPTVWVILGVGLFGAWAARKIGGGVVDTVAHAVDIIVQIPENVSKAVLPNPSIVGSVKIVENPFYDPADDPLNVLGVGP